jgi:NAD(P)H-hydrate epimerase
VDADALVLLAGHRDLQSYITKDDILTPHPGEAAALLRVQAAAVQADRFDSLNALCRLVPGVVLLKGAGSLASRQADPFLVSPYDIPQLAVGGSGDVLAGCIGALLARGRGQGGSLAAAGLGLVLHALAGLKCAARYPERGNTAGEIADAIPPALALCRRQPGAIP